ncbi:MAG: S-layer homology domain-containing protein [Clostridia bacterium]|nr:S-layer homology domain-containing protein [Clostridia bacterium]
MNGMGDGTFAPNADTTQGMMEQILFNIDGNEPVKAAEGESWWTAADGWAAQGGVTEGISTHDPKAPATREVDIMMMFNYAKAKGYDVSARASLDSFADASSVSAEAREALSWAVAAGIINGTTDKDGNLVLDAQGIAPRAQVSAMAERFCEKLTK